MITEKNTLGVDVEHPLSGGFTVIRHEDSSISFFPRDMRTTWMGDPITWGTVAIGRCTGIGSSATVRYNDPRQEFVLGRFTSIGARLRVILGGAHETRAMSMSKVQGYNPRLTFGLEPPDAPLRVSIGSDVWIGDDVTLMAGVQISDGCVIGTGSLLTSGTTTEPYGIYVGRPARLVRYRFPPLVAQALTMLRWWEWEIDTIEQVQALFVVDLTVDTERSLSLLQRLAELTADASRSACPSPNPSTREVPPPGSIA